MKNDNCYQCGQPRDEHTKPPINPRTGAGICPIKTGATKRLTAAERAQLREVINAVGYPGSVLLNYGSRALDDLDALGLELVQSNTAGSILETERDQLRAQLAESETRASMIINRLQKELAERDAQLKTQRESWITDHQLLSSVRTELSERDAQLAAMREALEGLMSYWPTEYPCDFIKAHKVLSTDAGAALLKELDELLAKLSQFQNAIPQTWGEICQKLGALPPCEPHEWDNRTSPENAVWALVTMVALQAENSRLKNICGDNLCWIKPGDEDIVKALPAEEFAESCRRYQAQLASNGVFTGGMTIAQLELENAELEASFDLRWNADARAIRRWRGSDPTKELTLILPDHADLCVWLLERLEEAKRDSERLDHAMRELFIIHPKSANQYERGGTVRIYDTRGAIDEAMGKPE